MPILVLDVGCGIRKQPGAIGIDRNPASHPDVLVDLEQFPYPFADNSFDRITAIHVIEHLGDVIRAMEEFHRLLRPGGTLRIETPHYSHGGLLDCMTKSGSEPARVNLSSLPRPRLGKEGAAMKIIGCDFHPSYQQIAWVDNETGELQELRLEHEKGEARRFYQALRGQRVRVGMEAVGNAQWFERMLAEMGHELWIGDAAQIRRLVVRQQKTDRRGGQHILALLLDGRFPRLWVPSPEMRDVRQLLRHRQKLGELRRQGKNQVQHLALHPGLPRERPVWE